MDHQWRVLHLVEQEHLSSASVEITIDFTRTYQHGHTNLSHPSSVFIKMLAVPCFLGLNMLILWSARDGSLHHLSSPYFFLLFFCHFPAIQNWICQLHKMRTIAEISNEKGQEGKMRGGWGGEGGWRIKVFSWTFLQLQQQANLLGKTEPRKLNGSLSRPHKTKLFWNSSILNLILLANSK